VVLAELMSPQLQAHETKTGQLQSSTLRPQKRNKWLVEDDSLDNGIFQIKPSKDQAGIFRVLHPDGNVWIDDIGSNITLDSHEVANYLREPGNLRLESDNGFSATFIKEDHFRTNRGVLVFSLLTRVTAWQGFSGIRIQHSIDVHSGIHQVKEWDLSLALDESADSNRLALPNDAEQLIAGDFSLQQISHNRWTANGKTQTGRLPGVISLDSFQAGIQDFWELHPSGISKNGSTLHLELCPEVQGQPVVFEEGFGRTIDIQLDMTPSESQTALGVTTRRLAKPPIVNCSPEWYLSSACFGNLGALTSPAAGLIHDTISASVEQILARREKFAQNDYGIQGFGDASGTARTISYQGSLQQEYDPALALFHHFLRTGNAKSLNLGLEFAWHYSDVDIAPYGGAFQHRATRRHVETWIANIFADTLAESVRSKIDGPVDLNAIQTWVSTEYEDEFLSTLQKWLDEENAIGRHADENATRMLRMIGMNEVILIERELNGGDDVEGMKSLAVGISNHPRAIELGFHDADTQFQDFFELYGGSWDSFPSFNVDTHPIPEKRHMGSHSIIESTVIAYLLTGEPRFKNSIIEFAKYQANFAAPNAIATLEENKQNSNLLFTRTVSWPITNFLSILPLTEGRPNYKRLQSNMLSVAEDCIDLLTSIDVTRVRSSIHAGAEMEALARWVEYSKSDTVSDFLLHFAQQWVNNMYDSSAHAFRYRPGSTDSGSRAMSGLCIRGLAFATTLPGGQDMIPVVKEAWENIPEVVSMSKSFGMHFRGVIPTIHIADSWGNP
jgi:hypothetical protein